MADIKVAYKTFALKLHPDVTGNNEVGALFCAVRVCVVYVGMEVPAKCHLDKSTTCAHHNPADTATRTRTSLYT